MRYCTGGGRSEIPGVTLGATPAAVDRGGRDLGPCWFNERLPAQVRPLPTGPRAGAGPGVRHDERRDPRGGDLAPMRRRTTTRTSGDTVEVTVTEETLEGDWRATSWILERRFPAEHVTRHDASRPCGVLITVDIPIDTILERIRRLAGSTKEAAP